MIGNWVQTETLPCFGQRDKFKLPNLLQRVCVGCLCVCLPLSTTTELNTWWSEDGYWPFPCRIVAMATKKKKKTQKNPLTHSPTPAAHNVYSSPSNLAGKVSLSRLLSWRLELAVAREREFSPLMCGGVLSVLFVSFPVGLYLFLLILNCLTFVSTLSLKKHLFFPS